MNNEFDAQQLYLQQLIAAQSQRGLSVPYHLYADAQLQNFHDRLSLPSMAFPATMELASPSVDRQQHLNMIQRMVLTSERALSNERLNSEFLLSQQQRIQSQQQERVLSQERAVAHERGLKRTYPGSVLPSAAYAEVTESRSPIAQLQGNLATHTPTPPQQQSCSTVSSGKRTPTAKSPLKPPKKKQDTKWLASYDELKQYKAEHGDCIVPRGYPLNPRLASWVAEQRKQYKLMKDGKQSSITPKRIELLNEIDFAWNAQEAAWDRHMTDLKRFKEEFSDCLVPLNHPKFPKLGLWVKEQRRHYTLMKQGKPSHMTEERARALDDVGFCWDTHEAVWGERLRELCQYKATYGDCIVPTNYGVNPKLGTWVHHQRRQYKKYKEGKACHITAERIRALDSLGFVWYPRERSRYNENVSGSDTESDTDLANLDLRPNKRQRT